MKKQEQQALNFKEQEPASQISVDALVIQPEDFVRLPIYDWWEGQIVIDKFFDVFKKMKVIGYDDLTGQVQLKHHDPPGGGSYYRKPWELVIAGKCEGDIELYFKMRNQILKWVDEGKVY